MLPHCPALLSLFSVVVLYCWHWAKYMMMMIMMMMKLDNTCSHYSRHVFWVLCASKMHLRLGLWHSYWYIHAVIITALAFPYLSFSFLLYGLTAHVCVHDISHQVSRMWKVTNDLNVIRISLNATKQQQNASTECRIIIREQLRLLTLRKSFVLQQCRSQAHCSHLRQWQTPSTSQNNKVKVIIWPTVILVLTARRSSSQTVNIRRTRVLLCRTFSLECSLWL